jgi:hypothetical protein
MISRTAFYSVRAAECWPHEFFVLHGRTRRHRDVVTVVGHAATISAGKWIMASGTFETQWTDGPPLSARGAGHHRLLCDDAQCRRLCPSARWSPRRDDVPRSALQCARAQGVIPGHRRSFLRQVLCARSIPRRVGRRQLFLGVVMCEMTNVNPRGRISPKCAGMWSDQKGIVR